MSPARRAVRSAASSVAVLVAGTATLMVGALPAAGQEPFTIDDVFDVASVRVLDVSPNGRWVVTGSLDLRGRLGTVAARTGDPTYVSPANMRIALVDTRSGTSNDLFPEPATVAGARFSPSGDRLALLVRRDGEYGLALVDVGSGDVGWPTLPSAVRLAGEQGQTPAWRSDEALVLPVRRSEWAADASAEFDRLTKGPITEYKGDDPFLAWEALRRAGGEAGLLELDLATGATEPVMEARFVGRDGVAVVGDHIVFDADVTESTSYDVIFGAELETRVLPLGGGTERTVMKIPEDRRVRWAKDRTHYAYSDEGHVYFAALDDDEARSLTGSEQPDDESVDESDDERERFTVTAVAPDGGVVAATSENGIWLIVTKSAERRRIVERSEDEPHPDRYDFAAWAPDASRIYYSFGSRTEWRRGLVEFAVDSGARRELIVDDRLYSGFRLSEDGSTFVFSAAEGNRPYDVFAADVDFSEVRRVYTGNPALERKRLGDTELVQYLDVDGEELHGVLYYPVDYSPGTAVPTVFVVYEQFFDNRFNSTIALLNNAGYAVMQPSVDLEIGFPGEAWLKGVSAAANELVRRGVADPERLGVHGTSYGGYATNLLITQTDRFAAAINVSGKVDMISFYTDSPRLGVRNIHAPENSQDRIGATLWEQPQKYIAHSAVMFADRIETPLLLMTGEEDHNVPARTTLEMYYALRRLGKTVEWVNYTNGGHGMPRTTEAEVRDYHNRILEWYERFLKEKPKPAATDQGSQGTR